MKTNSNFARTNYTNLHNVTTIKCLMLFTFLMGSDLLNAQDIPGTPNTKVNASSLLTQFANAIKPSSFTDNWSTEKNDWLTTATKATTPGGLSGSISSLAGFIKTSKFKNGFNAQSFMDVAPKVKSMTEVTGLLQKLEEGLKPEAMMESWAGKRSSWLNALRLIK